MKKNVCVDLDGVLAFYEGWKGIDHIGAPIPGAAEFTHRLAEFARVVVFTTRCKAYRADEPGPEGQPEPCRDDPARLAVRVWEWLHQHNFVCDEVYIGQGKPIAAAYVDDRAVCCTPQRVDGEFETALEAVKYLFEG